VMRTSIIEERSSPVESQEQASSSRIALSLDPTSVALAPEWRKKRERVALLFRSPGNWQNVSKCTGYALSAWGTFARIL
jgi:hypothetical protein